jgi:hypothetical protein
MNKLDTTTKPFIPEYLELVEFHDTSLGKIDPTKIELYLDDEQKDSKYIEGNRLREKLNGKPVLNAVVLDYLFEHQKLIPESWRGKWVYFWGTIYRCANGRLYVRCLYFGGRSWDRYCNWLDFDWRGHDPAALMTSELNRLLESRVLSKSSLSLETRIFKLESDIEKIKKFLII